MVKFLTRHCLKSAAWFQTCTSSRYSNYCLLPRVHGALVRVYSSGLFGHSHACSSGWIWLASTCTSMQHYSHKPRTLSVGNALSLVPRPSLPAFNVTSKKRNSNWVGRQFPQTVRLVGRKLNNPITLATKNNTIFETTKGALFLTLVTGV